MILMGQSYMIYMSTGFVASSWKAKTATSIVVWARLQASKLEPRRVMTHSDHWGQPSQFELFVSTASDTAAAGIPRGQVEDVFLLPPK